MSCLWLACLLQHLCFWWNPPCWLLFPVSMLLLDLTCGMLSSLHLRSASFQAPARQAGVAANRHGLSMVYPSRQPPEYGKIHLTFWKQSSELSQSTKSSREEWPCCPSLGTSPPTDSGIVQHNLFWKAPLAHADLGGQHPWWGSAALCLLLSPSLSCDLVSDQAPKYPCKQEISV